MPPCPASLSVLTTSWGGSFYTIVGCLACRICLGDVVVGADDIISVCLEMDYGSMRRDNLLLTTTYWVPVALSGPKEAHDTAEWTNE